MGIGRQQARVLLDAVKSATNRAQTLVRVEEAIDLLDAWRRKRREQDAEALPAFAESKVAQFNTFVAALPEVPVDQTP